MKCWSFWYFWSIFTLILATMRNLNTQIAVYQTRGAVQSRSTAFCLAPAPHPPAALAGPVVLATALGWAAASEYAQQAGQWDISAPTPLLDHNIRGSFLCLQSTWDLEAAWRKSIAMSYSLALLFGQPEMAEIESSVPLRKPGPYMSAADFEILLKSSGILFSCILLLVGIIIQSYSSIYIIIQCSWNKTTFSLTLRNERQMVKLCMISNCLVITGLVHAIFYILWLQMNFIRSVCAIYLKTHRAVVLSFSFPFNCCSYLCAQAQFG